MVSSVACSTIVNANDRTLTAYNATVTQQQTPGDIFVRDSTDGRGHEVRFVPDALNSRSHEIRFAGDSVGGHGYDVVDGENEHFGTFSDIDEALSVAKLRADERQTSVWWTRPDVESLVVWI